MLAQGGLLAAQVAASDSDYGGLYMAGAGLAAQLTMQKYGRDAELEADRYGIEYMKRAGYDAQGAVTLQETFVRMSGNKESRLVPGTVREPPAVAGAARGEPAPRCEIAARRRDGRRSRLRPRWRKR